MMNKEKSYHSLAGVSSSWGGGQVLGCGVWWGFGEGSCRQTAAILCNCFAAGLASVIGALCR